MSNNLNFAHDAFAVDMSAANLDALKEELRTLAHALVYSVFKQDRNDLEDDAISHVLLKLPLYKGEAQFSTWAYTVLRNFALMELRKERRRRECTLEAATDIPYGEDQSCQSFMTPLPERIITSLTSKERKLLALITQANGSLVTASRMSGRNKGTLYREWDRLRRRLRAMLQN